MTGGMAIFLLWVGYHFGKLDYHLHHADDPPIMESVLVVSGFTGLATLWKGVVVRSYLPVLVFSALMTALAFGAWWWTEFLYSRDLIGAFAARF
jgi:hypothetical protein